MPKRVTLISSDGDEFDVDLAIARLSLTVRRLVEVFCEDPAAAIPVPLTKISSPTLEKVIEWCIHHKDDAEEEDKSLEDMQEWNQHFLEIDNGALYDLIVAADYLDISSLLRATCKAVAEMFKGKSPDDLRRTFDIVNDLTDRAERVIEKETEWINIAMPYDSYYDESIEPFPLMSLSNDILSIILRQMRMVDRLRARVSRRLYLLEYLGRYKLSELHIVDGKASPVDPSNPGKLTIGLRFDVHKSSYESILQKISANVAVDSLIWNVCRRNIETLIYADLSDIFHCIARIHSRKLFLTDDWPICEINDNSLDAWTEKREFIDMANSRISGVALCRLINAMTDSSISLRRFHIHSHGRSKRTMLRRLGIGFNPENDFTCSRRELRIFSEQPDSERRVGSMHGLYFILIGESVLITVRMITRFLSQWYYGGEIWLERLNKDGSLPLMDYFEGARSIQSIVNKYNPIPIVYT